MKPHHLLTIILLFFQSCGVSRETIRYELPPKQAGDDPAKLQTILAFKTKDAEKLFDKDDSLLEGKEDEFKKIAGKESSNPIVLRALAKMDGKLTNLDKAKAIYEKAGLTNNSHYAWVLHDYGDYYKYDHNYFKAEEYYDSATKIFEGFGDSESLSYLLDAGGRNIINYYLDLESDEIDYNNFSYRLPKLHKAKELFLKQNVILNSKELKGNQNVSFQRLANLYFLGKIYNTKWIIETGKPERDTEKEQCIAQLNYEASGVIDSYYDTDYKESVKNYIVKYRKTFTDYRDYQIAKSYYEEALEEAKKQENYYFASKTALFLGLLYYRMSYYQGIEWHYSLNVGDARELKKATEIYKDKLDRDHTNRILSSKYLEEASIYAEKVKDFSSSVYKMHRSAMTYPIDGDAKERKRIFDLLLNKVEAGYNADKSLLIHLFSIKMDTGIVFVEKTGTEKEVLDYYTNIIEDKRFTKEFYKKENFIQIPQSRLSRYFSIRKNYCEAAKWEKESIAYFQLSSIGKPNTKGLERFTRKCSKENSTTEKTLARNESNKIFFEAIINGDFSKIQAQIVKGADPNIEFDIEYKSEKTGQIYPLDATALILSAGEGHKEIVSYLIKKGANINQTDSKEFTSLHYAVSQNQKEIVRLLIENKADVNLGIYSPLMSASQNNLYAVAKILIESKANVNAIDSKGNTALLLAAQSGNLEIVDLLIKNKADINIINKLGYTAIKLARENRYEKVVEFLRSKGAKG